VKGYDGGERYGWDDGFRSISVEDLVFILDEDN